MTVPGPSITTSSKLAVPFVSASACQDLSAARSVTASPGNASVTTICAGTPVRPTVGVSISSAVSANGHPVAMAATTNTREALSRASVLRGLMFLFLPQDPAEYYHDFLVLLLSSAKVCVDRATREYIMPGRPRQDKDTHD